MLNCTYAEHLKNGIYYLFTPQQDQRDIKRDKYSNDWVIQIHKERTGFVQIT